MGMPKLRQTTCRTFSSRSESLLPKNMRTRRGGDGVKRRSAIVTLIPLSITNTPMAFVIRYITGWTFTGNVCMNRIVSAWR